MSKIKDFLKKKNVEISFKRYFIDAMGAMAQGLFASLLIGTIFSTVAVYTKIEFFETVSAYAKSVSGAAIGVAIASALNAPALVMFSSAAVGMMGYSEAGAGPAGAFFAVLVAVELGKLISKQTRVDILATPTVTILSGALVSVGVCPFVGKLMTLLGNFVNNTTELHPFLMGVVVSVVVGIVLTLPISSAALCASIGIAGIAGGAALAGCSAQMIGFAVISFRENRWNGLLAQGLGTSMLQMGNIIRRPVIWLPVTLASAITGPVSTMIFKLQCVGVSAGMGTCGLVGPIGAIAAPGEKNATFWIGLVLVCFVLPAVLSLLFNELFRKIGLIRDGDMKLDL